MIKKLIFALFVTTSLASCAQESVVFKPKFKANTKYRNDMKMNVRAEIEVDGDEAMAETLEQNGSQMPMVTTTEMMITSITTTDKTDKSGNIPVTMVFEKMSSKMTMQGKTIDNENPYKGMKILGKYDNDLKFILDSIVGGNVTEELKSGVTTMLKSMQNAITFPEKPMKVGETFKSDAPLNLPIPGMQSAAAKMEIDYLLTEIKGNKAYFDVTQKILMNMSNEKAEMAANGTGTGKMVYDIKEQFITTYKADMPMEMTMKMNENRTMKMKMSSSTEQTTTIE